MARASSRMTAIVGPRYRYRYRYKALNCSNYNHRYNNLYCSIASPVRRALTFFLDAVGALDKEKIKGPYPHSLTALDRGTPSPPTVECHLDAFGKAISS